MPPPLASPASRDWHTGSVDAVFERVESAPAGLTSQEAARRLGRHGPNVLQATRRVTRWAILAEQFKNLLIVILLVATGVSALSGRALEATAIAVIVVLAVVLGFVQEYRAERAIEALRQMAAPTTTVVRDGDEVVIAARELVPGDMVRLQAGDRIPADVRLVEAMNLTVEESALTGESVPVEKGTTPLDDPHLAPADQTNMAFAGTVVTYGRGRAVVVATGMATEFGQIAALLQAVGTSRTPLQANLDQVGRTLVRAALVMVTVIVGLGMLRGQPVLDMVMFGIALAVAVVPEALPAVVTISLAIGVQRMARRQALVRRLAAVETLGSTRVICADKTGTLTRDEMTVRAVFVGGEMLSVTGAGYDPRGQFVRSGEAVNPGDVALRLLQAGSLASDARIVRDEAADQWGVQGDPTEGALVVAAAKAGLDQGDLVVRFPRVDEIPFTSETRRMTTLHTTPDGVVAYSKGAPEVILESCTRVLEADGAVPLDSQRQRAILDAAAEMAGQALRVLAVATKQRVTRESAEQEMTMLGLVGMLDPPRPEATRAIQRCRDAGISVVMITGDHPTTAAAVARELGLLHEDRLVTGLELAAMSDDRLREDVTGISVFARVSPSDKLRIVTAFQDRGYVTAMTGDGVNDAPALKKADIGIAMGITGTDVSKEAADMSLTDDNFASIVAAVEEGRGIYDNIQKYLSYLLAANIGEIALVAGASVLGLPLPLTAVQILSINLATDGPPALALAVDPPSDDLMRRPPRDVRIGIWSRSVITLMLVAGGWSALVTLTVFTWALSNRALDHAMALVFVTLVLIEFAKAYAFRSHHRSVLTRPFANTWLNWAVGVEIALLLLVVYVPWLQTPMGTYSFTAEDWLIAVAGAATVLPVLDGTKRWLVRAHGAGG